MPRKGETWNESEVYRDAWTLREVRCVTTQGLYNQTPTYHTNTAFTADGEFLVFGTGRAGQSYLCACHVPTGDITQLIDPVDGLGNYGALHKRAGSGLASPGRRASRRAPVGRPLQPGARCARCTSTPSRSAL